MKILLEEAGRMLKSMPPACSLPQRSLRESGDAKIRRLQRQLDELKGSSLRVLRLARVQAATEDLVSVDSGATHPLRPPKEGEKIAKYQKVKINLAGGKQTLMSVFRWRSHHRSRRGGTDRALGALVEDLGCTIQWTEGLYGPFPSCSGQIQIQLKENCPMIAKTDALELINELEERSPCVRSLEVVEGEAYEEWMKDVVKSHPALKGLPKEDFGKIGREAKRRASRWKQEPEETMEERKEESSSTCTQEPSDGYTMARAIQQLGGQKRKVLQVDLKNGEKWDLMRDDLYSEILQMVIDGQVETILMSPNCRTRSKLRHHEVEGVNLPGPVRAWGEGEEWGKKGIEEKERQKCFEDDVLLFRGLMMYIIAQEVRKASTSPNMLTSSSSTRVPPANMPQLFPFGSLRSGGP